LLNFSLSASHPDFPLAILSNSPAMEALAAGASAIAVVQVADRILTLCGKYTLGVKYAKEDIERLENEVAALSLVLNSVEEMTRDGTAKLSTSKSLLEELVKSIARCRADLDDLEIRLDPSKGRKLMSRFGLRALKWPFKNKDVTKVIKALDRHKSTIVLALNVDQR
jgi:hypothetical protein